jgi:uncharacterized repeat protein (TIGR02543 family)
VKPGYGLAGWYKDAALTEPFDFGTSLAADTTLYAKWVRHEVPMIGAIRWDAFNGYVPDEALSLSPIQHHYRVPYFLGFDGSGAVTGHENSQATIDEQIAYAKAGGIDYWAFVTGPELSPNNNEYYALNKYLSSSTRPMSGFPSFCTGTATARGPTGWTRSWSGCRNRVMSKYSMTGRSSIYSS